MALLSAAATLLGALFICLSPPADEHSQAAEDPTGLAFSCPHDGGPCGPRPPVGAAVLTAPPLDDPPAAGEQAPRFDRPPPDSGQPRSDAPPRTPGLHVLQVLRI
ncbi:hypothetical protein ACIBCM_01765 [Streptomyces sp. NPDC051018]|uniref:hypothetical protein n=1 Tax=Streptomyces sp. NPDC051018 TaxID=3365639 RepID=UPI00378F832D